MSFTTSSILQGCYDDTITNVANGSGVYSIESEGLHLPGTSTHWCSYYSTSPNKFIFCICQLPKYSGQQSKLQISHHDDNGLINVCKNYLKVYLEYRTVKNINGEKTLTNFANYSISPSFLPIFIISITFPMQMNFNSPKFFSFFLFHKLFHLSSSFRFLHGTTFVVQ